MTEASIQICVPYHREEEHTLRPVYVLHVLCVHTSEGNRVQKYAICSPAIRCTVYVLHNKAAAD